MGAQRDSFGDFEVWKETKRIYGVDFQKALKYEGPILPNFVPVRDLAGPFQDQH